MEKGIKKMQIAFVTTLEAEPHMFPGMVALQTFHRTTPGFVAILRSWHQRPLLIPTE